MYSIKQIELIEITLKFEILNIFTVILIMFLIHRGICRAYINAMKSDFDRETKILDSLVFNFCENANLRLCLLVIHQLIFVINVSYCKFEFTPNQ